MGPAFPFILISQNNQRMMASTENLITAKLTAMLRCRPLSVDKKATLKCSAFDMEVIFHSHAIKTHFHKNGCALGLILKVRVFGTRKWPIESRECSNVIKHDEVVKSGRYSVSIW